jgi:hypothetical protein
MKFILPLFVFISVFLSSLTFDPLVGRVPENHWRYPTYKRALELMEERGAKILVETGTARGGASDCLGDGCSTVIFGHYATVHNCQFYSVDINANNVNNSRAAVKQYAANVIHDDSINFLANFPYQIDFLYLDSYDFDFWNPEPSQQHHLKEISAVYPHLTDKTIIMIDDCDLPHGGKGKYVIQYLLERGWKIAMQGYQVIMVKA